MRFRTAIPIRPYRKIEDFCEIIQTNTDGILVKLKTEDYGLLDDTVYEWEKRTGLHMSFDEYTKSFKAMLIIMWQLTRKDTVKQRVHTLKN